ncbi:MAG: clostripain-related cysteine peptidase [Thermoplasmata archaeon]|nr:clostripain-related cysteine peptidase [Thermoplasmata archaeon]
MAPGISTAQDSQEKWTFIVYMSGDSSLEENIALDLSEMKNVGSSENLDVIVLMDFTGTDDTSMARVLKGGMEDIALSQVNSSWGSELELGKPETLSQFVIWAADEYPADRLMLDLWGHGSGWPGICPDKGDFLSTVELGIATDSIAEAGVHIDIISMDACQMGMLEVAYEIRGNADYAMMSQKDVPLAGWPYDGFLGSLAGSGTVGEKGQAMIDSYISWGKANSMYSLTLAMVNLSEMGLLVDALGEYSFEAESTAGYFNEQFIAARSSTEKYDGNAQYDLANLLENVNNQTRCKSLGTLAESVLAALNSSIVYEVHWTNVLDPERADHANGLSVWFPTYSPTSDYLATSFAQDSGWPDFLEAMSVYFQDPGRIDAPFGASATAADSDTDGLLDTIRVSAADQDYGDASVEIYGPGGSLFGTYALESPGTLDISPESLGYYQAAIYLRDSDGNLLNYTFIGNGLAREGMSVISGQVTSNTGRGLRWVSVNLVNASGQVIESAVTDRSGHYEMKVIVPTDTDGVNLTLECGFGSTKTNTTLDRLDPELFVDFELESSSQYIGLLIWTSAVLNMAGIAMIAYGSARGRKKQPEPQERKI